MNILVTGNNLGSCVPCSRTPRVVNKVRDEPITWKVSVDVTVNQR
jgi:hypothetical protein